MGGFCSLVTRFWGLVSSGLGFWSGCFALIVLTLRDGWGYFSLPVDLSHWNTVSTKRQGPFLCPSILNLSIIWQRSYKTHKLTLIHLYLWRSSRYVKKNWCLYMAVLFDIHSFIHLLSVCVCVYRCVHAPPHTHIHTGGGQEPNLKSQFFPSTWKGLATRLILRQEPVPTELSHLPMLYI